MTVFTDVPFASAERLDLDPIPLAVVRRHGVRLGDLRDAFDQDFAAFGRAFGEGMLAPAGPAIAVYDGDPRDVFDLAIGFPVAEALSEDLPLDAETTITASALPAGPAFVTTVIGSYEGLGAAWPRLAEAAEAAGVRPSGTWIEIYVSDPSSTAEANLVTHLVLPVVAGDAA